MMERMFAVAIRDEKNLFLWLRIRRAPEGDVYVMLPTGRQTAEWKKWNPHGSQHKDGHFHHKSFDRKLIAQERQKPDCNFRGTENLITRPIASDEPRAFGVICNPAEFSGVLEVPANMLSTKKYEMSISIDLTEPDSPPIITPGSRIVAQRAFNDSIPWILVSVFLKTPVLDLKDAI
jgi:hypothetical protein